jgi:hypothetical protein
MNLAYNLVVGQGTTTAQTKRGTSGKRETNVKNGTSVNCAAPPARDRLPVLLHGSNTAATSR